jgi:N-acetylglucosamine-6-phosphate deacetylase
MRLKIIKCRLFNSLDTGRPLSILCQDGRIQKIGRVRKNIEADRVLDAEGRIIVPGFIDVHIQGAGGADVLDGKKEALETIARTCPRFGTTSFLATTVFRPKNKNHHLEIAARNTGRDLGGANLIGIHLEGPFISHEKKGMIQADCICEPSQEMLELILKLVKGNLRIMTIAPEITGGISLIQRLVLEGIVASFGHSNASYEETLRGIEAGITHVTHLFNAMPALHHRQPGPLLALFRRAGPTVQIIPDGVHLHHRVLKFAFDTIGVNRCITITDGMQAMGLPDGTYVYNGVEYDAKNGTARYHDGTLIGTAMGMIDLVQKLMEYTQCPLEDAVKTVTENPAALLGLSSQKGSIDVEKDADLVILDHDYSVWATIVGGKVVYQKGKS